MPARLEPVTVVWQRRSAITPWGQGVCWRESETGGGGGGPPRAARAFPFIWEEEGSGEVAGGGGAEEAARSLLGLPERRLSIRAERDGPRHGA